VTGIFLVSTASVAVILAAHRAGAMPDKFINWGVIFGTLNWMTVPDGRVDAQGNLAFGLTEDSNDAFIQTYFQGRATLYLGNCRQCINRRCGVATDGTIASCASTYGYSEPQGADSKRCMCGCCSAQCLADPTCVAEAKDVVPYKVVTSGTCESNGYFDILTFPDCIQVLNDGYYLSQDQNDNGIPDSNEAYPIDALSETTTPPGCWPITPDNAAFPSKTLPTANINSDTNSTVSCSTIYPCFCYENDPAT